jgi:hypothetical protein
MSQSLESVRCPPGACGGCDRARSTETRSNELSPRTILAGLPVIGWLLEHLMERAWPNTGGKR